MKPPIKLPVEKLIEEPYASILCYPRANPQEAQNRILELKGLGVTEIEFAGGCLAANIPVLGKGYAGVVVAASVGEKRLALKMRRMDSDKDNFFHEAEMLQKANSIGVGPRFESVSKNFLLSQLIDGGTLATRLENHMEKAFFCKILGDILEQCRRLDEAGLDHGELSKASGHLLVDKAGKPYIVDFETAGVRKVSNVTSVCRYLFLGNNAVSKLTEEVLEKKDKSQIVSALQDYKKEMFDGQFDERKERSKKRFEALLRACLLPSK